MSEKTQYRFVGTHPQDLSDGRVLGPLDLVDLTEDEQRDPHNRALLDAGLLVPLDQPATARKSNVRQAETKETS